ncbi:calcium-binding protein [Streptomyces litmocidini]|uniref:EF-hand domain-containing protein n=1 Tax=Streptomyces litmocidini TaxID=67318 RepID=UPI00167D6537|nr:EF-hand domain-containing protein [Streptomyces litmocidini]GGV17776.1 calcium-binding protein [Streptomyces litmocidini]
MFTSLQLDRAQQRFDTWDVNGDGQIDRSDWQAEAQQILKALRVPSVSPAGRALTEAYLGMWSFFAGEAGIDEEDGSLNLDQFNHIAHEHIVEDSSSGFGRVVRPVIEAMVELVDTDGDHQVNPPEFKTWLDAINASNIDPAEAFRQIDTDGDGQLSVDELVQAVRAYHMGDIDVPLLGH